MFLTLKDGELSAKTKLKGAFNGEPTSITQFDASNNKLPSDFMLTTGSKINVLVTLVVYDPTKMDGSGYPTTTSGTGYRLSRDEKAVCF